MFNNDVIYISHLTFCNWLKDLKNEIIEKMTRSGSLIAEKKYFSLENRMTRKHVGFEFSSSKNGKPFLFKNGKPFSIKGEIYFPKQVAIKIKILNKNKFLLFMFKYSKDFNFIDEKFICNVI